MKNPRADGLLIAGAVVLAVSTIVLAQVGLVAPAVAVIGNAVAASVVFVRRTAVKRWMQRPQAARRTSTAARRMTEVVGERS